MVALLHHAQLAQAVEKSLAAGPQAPGRPLARTHGPGQGAVEPIAGAGAAGCAPYPSTSRAQATGGSAKAWTDTHSRQISTIAETV